MLCLPSLNEENNDDGSGGGGGGDDDCGHSLDFRHMSLSLFCECCLILPPFFQRFTLAMQIATKTATVIIIIIISNMTDSKNNKLDDDDDYTGEGLIHQTSSL